MNKKLDMTYEKFKALGTAWEEEDCWSTCIELREAKGRLWERHLADLEGQEQELDCFIREFLSRR